MKHGYILTSINILMSQKIATKVNLGNVANTM